MRLGWIARAVVAGAVVGLSALGVVPAYADPPGAGLGAGVRITIAVTPPTIVSGESSTILGNTTAPSGSRVVLQEKKHGAWRAVREQRVTGTHRVGFTVTPASGLHTYRLWLPFQRVSSLSAQLRVKSRPTLTLGLAWSQAPSGDRVVVASGTTSVTGTGNVLLQLVLPGGTVAGLGSVPLASGSFSTSLAFVQGEHRLSPGTQVRATLPGSANRAPAEAASSVPGLDPLVVGLNDPAGLRQPELAADAGIALDATVGEEISLRFDATAPLGAIVDPVGVPVTTHARGDAVVDFVAARTGRYLIDVDGSLTSFYASTPKVVQVQLDHPFDLDSDLPGQVLEVEFPAAAGQPLRLDVALDGQPATSADAFAVLAPGGATLSPWIAAAPGIPAIHRPQTSGSHRIRYDAPGAVSLSGTVETMPVVQAPVDEGPVSLDVALPADYGLVEIADPAHEPFALRQQQCRSGDHHDWVALVDAEGQSVGDASGAVAEPVADTYYVLVGNGASIWSPESRYDVTWATTGAPQALPGDPSCDWYRGSLTLDAGTVLGLGFDGGQPVVGPAFVGPSSPWPAGPGTWVFPAAGTYTWDFWGADLSGTGNVTADAWSSVDLPGDGSPLEVTPPASGHQSLRLGGPPGADYDLALTGDPLDSWTATVWDAGGNHALLATIDSVDGAGTAVVSVDHAEGVYVLWTTGSPAPAPFTVTATPL